jgi:putative redox protein
MKATVRSPERGETAELRIEGITPSDDGVSIAGRAAGGPSPAELLAASLASCTATTIERYARRKGWEVAEVEVDVDYTPAQRGSPTRCAIVVRLPEDVPPERRERLMQVGATSQLHRTLEGEIVFDERVELTAAPDAGRPDPQPPRTRIALLNGLRGAQQGPPE